MNVPKIPAKKYVVFKPLDKLTENEQPEIVVFLVNADQLSALAGMANYDQMTQGERVMFFYFAKGTAEWKGYEVNTLPRFTVVEMSETVDAETAFALPPAGFTKKANEQMRNYANRLMQNR